MQNTERPSTRFVRRVADPKRPFQIMIDTPIRQALERISDQEGCSMGEAARRLIEAGLALDGKRQP